MRAISKQALAGKANKLEWDDRGDLNAESATTS